MKTVVFLLVLTINGYLFGQDNPEIEPINICKPVPAEKTLSNSELIGLMYRGQVRESFDILRTRVIAETEIKAIFEDFPYLRNDLILYLKDKTSFPNDLEIRDKYYRVLFRLAIYYSEYRQNIMENFLKNTEKYNFYHERFTIDYLWEFNDLANYFLPIFLEGDNDLLFCLFKEYPVYRDTCVSILEERYYTDETFIKFLGFKSHRVRVWQDGVRKGICLKPTNAVNILKTIPAQPDSNWSDICLVIWYQVRDYCRPADLAAIIHNGELGINNLSDQAETELFNFRPINIDDLNMVDKNLFYGVLDEESLRRCFNILSRLPYKIEVNDPEDAWGMLDYYGEHYMGSNFFKTPLITMNKEFLDYLFPFSFYQAMDSVRNILSDPNDQYGLKAAYCLDSAYNISGKLQRIYHFLGFYPNDLRSQTLKEMAEHRPDIIMMNAYFMLESGVNLSRYLNNESKRARRFYFSMV